MFIYSVVTAATLTAGAQALKEGSGNFAGTAFLGFKVEGAEEAGKVSVVGGSTGITFGTEADAQVQSMFCTPGEDSKYTCGMYSITNPTGAGADDAAKKNLMFAVWKAAAKKTFND